ncbi:hypothetical protein SAMN02982997_01256 [Legionella micdadei]|uniref:Uncharacterized protein n=1 Tax=Legionella micdadei TaxID=451 RepID=A0A1G5EH38_LEGMI|nr:hypothetical protein Lmic_2499 [Legionella micdadei]SCY26313.1 hypothetical protein SAMN02982997_01256 [Legionella micdadei]
MAGIFTSNLLAQLQLSLVKDYQQFLSEHKTYEEICSLLRSKLDCIIIKIVHCIVLNLPRNLKPTRYLTLF